MYISKAVSNYISIFLRYLRLFEVFNRSGKCPLWDASNQENICRAFVWSGKYPSGMCLVEEVSVGDLSGRGNVCRGSVRRGRVSRGNVLRGCVRESQLRPAQTLKTGSVILFIHIQ